MGKVLAMQSGQPEFRPARTQAAVRPSGQRVPCSPSTSLWEEDSLAWHPQQCTGETPCDKEDRDGLHPRHLCAYICTHMNHTHSTDNLNFHLHVVTFSLLCQWSVSKASSCFSSHRDSGESPQAFAQITGEMTYVKT